MSFQSVCGEDKLFLWWDMSLILQTPQISLPKAMNVFSTDRLNMEFCCCFYYMLYILFRFDGFVVGSYLEVFHSEITLQEIP